MRRRLRLQKGQVVALTAVGMLALIALAAFVIDVGVAYRAQRNAQAAADASALGAAQLLPASPSLATTTATNLGATNLPGGSVTTAHDGCSPNPCYSTTYVPNDTVTVYADTTTPGIFARALDAKFDTFKESAKATATVGSYTGWSTNIAPWAIAQQDLVWGQTVQFKTQTAGTSGNFGGTQLPVVQVGCNLSTGGNDYRDLIENVENSCLVSVGDVLQSKTGNLAGPTQQGLDNRVVAGMNVQQNFCLTPATCPILKQQPDGSYVLTTYNHPNLIVIPVVDSISNGKTTYTVVGFAWFIIQNYDSKDVWGMFVGSEAPSGAKCPTATDPNAPCPVGGYTDLGFKVIRLSG
jgi:Flp pilus assembly protein TadG